MKKITAYLIILCLAFSSCAYTSPCRKEKRKMNHFMDRQFYAALKKQTGIILIIISMLFLASCGTQHLYVVYSCTDSQEEHYYIFRRCCDQPFNEALGNMQYMIPDNEGNFKRVNYVTPFYEVIEQYKRIK